MARVKKRRFGWIRTIIVFVAGVATGVYLFGPERPTVGNLLDPDERRKVVDFDQAGQRVSEAADMVGFYACKAKDYVGDRLDE